jgi:predicted DNA binding CopG/RHH family protein
MQAMQDLEIETPESRARAVPWWEAAPFHGKSSFASVLSAAVEPQFQLQPDLFAESDAAARSEPDCEEATDPALLSYESALRVPAAADDTRKSSSIHIRLSAAESAQLKQRAAEAGLTVSAYLRSCVLEAESLRAQVKQALAQLRATPIAEKPRRWWQRKG